MAKRKKRGLASADERTRQRVARKGGEAYHEVRGLQGANKQTRQEVARKGGQARARSRSRRR